MKKQILTGVILIAAILTVNGQIYTPSSTIQGSSENNNVGIGTNSPSSKLSIRNVGGYNGMKLIDFSELNDEEFMIKGNFGGEGATGNSLVLV